MNEEIPVVQATDYRSALHFTNSIHHGLQQLPLYIQVRQSRFKVTKENFDALSLGVLMAAEWPESMD